MNRAAAVVVALGALIGAQASAQVVVGGSGVPNVEVNWSVLDRLGPQPNLPGMLIPESRVGSQAQRLSAGGAVKPPTAATAGNIQFKPYKPERPVKTAEKKATPAKAKPIPVAAEARPAKPATSSPATNPDVTELLQAARTAAKAPAPVVEPAAVVPTPAKPVAPVVALPQEPKQAKVEPVPVPAAPPKPAPVALPEPPKVEPIVKPVEAVKAPEPAPKPVQLAKVEPPPAPAPALQPPPAAAQVAALPAPAPAPVSSAVSRSGGTLSIAFPADDDRLPDTARAEVEKLARQMEKDPNLALQLLAYAEGSDANASKARRLSLSRALAIRKQLMDMGVRSTRIEVRALGNKIDGGAADRVDAVLAPR